MMENKKTTLQQDSPPPKGLGMMLSSLFIECMFFKSGGIAGLPDLSMKILNCLIPEVPDAFIFLEFVLKLIFPFTWSQFNECITSHLYNSGSRGNILKVDDHNSKWQYLFSEIC